MLQRIFSAKSKTHDMAAPIHLPGDVCAEIKEGPGPQFQVVSAGRVSHWNKENSIQEMKEEKISWMEGIG